ncbi:hypothetical protein [Actinopolymorpha pittospori]|uniref:Excreted virulence factor EspC, type VII ESX diderm n=1 Tax=Actinopolymorpha pittospori TaxID=648752 RepID=A0A927N367_9ACTN|nr:hypothetical protein [Actinopolymorpha pittospori]MBE1611825.1 hypothetical protein [Actinopolymorpha pittospori]
MVDVHVRPENIHLAAEDVDTAGQDWGESVEELTSSMKDADSGYGGDELGAALKEMYQAAGPTALTYFTETGFCVVETAIAMNQMADAYTVVERDNTAQTAKVQSIVDSLGDP